ncbi:MAG: ABC transporter ATP-binding protein [Bradymonadaceae bacterium]|nr:ABC transporter ATP-binding protein [Lujinxingiaceae bacterium]
MMSAPSKSEDTKERLVARVGGETLVIAARRLSLWYGQVIGINDITIDIGNGVIGLLGPNGAGKSTLMKVLTGQLQPSTGAVSIFGQRVWNNAELFARVGFVPEQDAFYEEMTGRAFVTYLTRLQGFGKADAARLADAAIEEVDLVGDRDRKIEEYSKGMRQRIKIAQALAHKPDLLFMDEPLNGTDPVGRRHIIDLIRRFGEGNRTVIVSSHILHEVEQMTSDILLVNKGRVVADGNIYRIREMIDEHPHTIFVDCSEPRRFAAMFAAFADVVRIEFTEAGFALATTEPDACYSRIPALAIEHGIVVRRMTSPDNNLMAVFNYLVR